jgi:hypothetical protein
MCDCTDLLSVYAGIVVGVAIGVGCIILCAVAVVWRRRCIKSASAECGDTNAHQANGNGYYKAWDRSATAHARIMAAPCESHELDYFVAAVTANIPCDDSADHLDTKVHIFWYPQCYG